MEGDLKSGGHILSASSGSGSSRQTFNYSTDRVVGNGSFGVVFQATCLETGETVSSILDVGRSSSLLGTVQRGGVTEPTAHSSLLIAP